MTFRRKPRAGVSSGEVLPSAARPRRARRAHAHPAGAPRAPPPARGRGAKLRAEVEALVAASVAAAFALRFNGAVPWALWPGYLFAGLVAVAVVGLLFIYGVYRVSWSFVSLRDVASWRRCGSPRPWHGA